VSATFAAIIAAPLSGSLIQVFHHFYPAFYLYAVLQVISALFTLKIDLSFKPPAQRILGCLREVLSKVEIIIFFCAMLISGKGTLKINIEIEVLCRKSEPTSRMCNNVQ
jgi:hypothetical protein